MFAGILAAVFNNVSLSLSNHPLYFVAERGDLEMVQSLLGQGREPDSRAYFGGNFVGGVIKSDTPLHAATSKGHTATVEALLKVGASSDAGFSLGLGLLGFGSPLFEAASKEGHTATVEALLKAGASPDAGSPIAAATEEGHHAIVESGLLGFGSPLWDAA